MARPKTDKTGDRGHRNRLIQLIHVAKRQLHLDDDAYRALLQEVTGKESCRGLGIRDLNAVVDHLVSKGFQPTGAPRVQMRRYRGPGKPVESKSVIDQQIGKMMSLWHELADLGAVRNREMSALRAFICKRCKVDRAEWMSPAQAVQLIEMLKSWLKRVEEDPEVDRE